VATKTTRVTAVIAAKVEGGADITALAKQLDKLPDQQDIAVGAEVTGTKELNGLADTVDQLPTSTSTRISADVTGDTDVSGLATDIDGLPRSTSAKVAATVTGERDVAGLTGDVKALPGTTNAKVAATVTGDEQVSDLTGDIKALPGTTDAKVDATVTGNQQVDSLFKQLAAMPTDKTVNVKANVSSNGKAGTSGIKDLNDEIDGTRRKSRDLGIEGAAFGSQFLGPFSEGAAIIGDLSEQLRNIGDEAEGAGGKLKGLATAGAGLAVGAAIGIAIDTMVKGYQAAQQRAQQLLTLQDSITKAIIESGNANSTAARQAELDGIKQTDVYKTLQAAGIRYQTIIEGLTDPTKFGALQDAIKSTGAGVDDFWSRSIGGKPQATKNLIDAAAAISGVSAAAAASAPEVAAVDQAFLGVGKSTSSAVPGLTAAGDVITGLSGSLDGAAAAAAAAQQQTAATFAGWGTAADNASGAIDTVGTSLSTMADDAAQSAIDTDGVSTALDGISSAASDAQRDLQFLGAELDKLAGRDRTAEQAAADLSSGILGLADAFTGAKKDKELDKKALVNWNVAALNATKGGQAIYESINQVSQGYDESVDSAYEAGAATGDYAKATKLARKAADDARKSFVKQATAQGLTVKQAQKLADKVGILAGKDIPDKSFKVLADDKKAQKALKDLEATKLAAKVLKVNADKSPADRALALLKNQKLAAKIQQIKGDSTDAKTKIKQLIALGIPPKEAEIIANAKNVDAAQAEIEALAKTYQAYINVSLLGVDLVEKTLGAIQGIIDNLTGGSHMATAPDTGGGTSAQLSVTSTSAAPAPSASQAVFRAPGGGLTVNNIRVQGAVDPASTARQIKQILTRAERRVGPIRAGTTTGLRAPV